MEKRSFDVVMDKVPCLSISEKTGKKQVLRAEFRLTGDVPQDFSAEDAVYMMRVMSGLVNKELQDLTLKKPEDSKKISGCMGWVNKRANGHPKETRDVVEKIVPLQEFSQDITQLVPLETVRNNALIIASVCDLGRLMEVNMIDGQKYDITTVMGMPRTHADLSYAFMKKIPALNRPEIYLPVKYHELPNDKFEQVLTTDGEFLSLPPEKQMEVILMSYLQRDSDKLALLGWYQKVGSKVCGERQQASYQDVNNEMVVTPICLERFQKGEMGLTSESHTYLDCHLRWLGWYNNFHMNFLMGNVAKEVFSNLWDRTEEELYDEYMQKDRERLGQEKEPITPKRTLKYEQMKGCFAELRADMMMRLDSLYRGVPVHARTVVSAKERLPLSQMNDTTVHTNQG